MVFGFGAGKINVSLNKSNYSFSETIKGKAMLDLKNPINARGVKVSFYGEETTSTYRNGKKTTNTRKVNEITLMLEEGEKEYNSKEYNFELKIPQYNSSIASFELGPLKLNLTGRGRIKWFLVVALDIPMGFDVSKKIQLNLT